MWLELRLGYAEKFRESKWTESIAVGSRDFVDVIKRGLGVKAKGRRISGMDDESALR
jgi:putative transposase